MSHSDEEFNDLESRLAHLEAWRLRVISAAEQAAQNYLREHRDVMADMTDTPIYKFYAAFFE